MPSILVIDDEPQVRTLARAILECSGYQVCEAANGVEGVKAYKRHSFNLVICDIFMPEKDGYETIRELHAANAKIIGMTGSLLSLAWPAHFEIARRFGAARVMLKPFRASELLDEVHGVLSKH